MEPQIRYVKSADGATLATSTLGGGPPLMLLSSPGAATIEMWWAIPDARASLERLAARFAVVLFDSRGSGLSDREVEDFFLEARIADIEAVFAGLTHDRVFVVARSMVGPQAITFAARHPELVRRLALVAPIARGRDWHQTPVAVSSHSSFQSITSCIGSAWGSLSSARRRSGSSTGCSRLR